MPNTRDARLGLRRSGAVVILLASACAAVSQSARTAEAGASDRERVIAAVIDHFARGSEGPLLVDPRSLREGADLTGLDADDLAEDTATRAVTARALAKRGFRTTDALLDMRCAFVRGVSPPPEILASEPEEFRRVREACLGRGLYTTVIFGIPRVSGADGARGTWTIRVVRMTTSAYSVWDVPVRVNAGGAWEALMPQRVFGVTS